MNLNDLEFYSKFLFDNNYEIVDRKENKILNVYDDDKFKLDWEFLELWEIKDKINKHCDEIIVHYVFKQHDHTVLQCKYNFLDDEETEFLRKKLGLAIVDTFYNEFDDEDYYYIECKKV